MADGGHTGTSSDAWSWALGLFYIVAVASIWIAASYIVQSVVDSGVSPFLITYICNSLFVVYIPIVEIGRVLEDTVDKIRFWRGRKNGLVVEQPGYSIRSPLSECDRVAETSIVLNQRGDDIQTALLDRDDGLPRHGADLGHRVTKEELDEKGRWTRIRVAKVGFLISPFWFLAQLTFNLSLKYTTVTSNTILSSASSLFTFLVSLAFLGESFTMVKLVSVLLCMGGSVIVSFGDSQSGGGEVAINPLLGDALALVSACLYAIYITLIRVKMPDERKGEGKASMAQFLGFLGLFNFLIFFPVALALNFTGIETFHMLNWEQFGLVVGKGLLDNVFSDYLWAKAVMLTTTTVATAGLTIQVPIAAVVDSLIGHAPNLLDCIGAAAIMVGFAGINVNSDDCCGSQLESQTDDEVASV